MSYDTAINREPFLNFIRARAYCDAQTMIHHCQTSSIDPDNLNIRTWPLQIFSHISDNIPEPAYIESLLTHSDFVLSDMSHTLKVTQSYFPAPGTEDAHPLFPNPLSKEFTALVPPEFQRTFGWLVLVPSPRLVILTYDPASLADLPTAKDFWAETARRRHPTVVDDISYGLCTPHQILKPSRYWLRAPVPEHLVATAESQSFEPFLVTDISLFCWHDPAKPPSDRARSETSNLLYREVISYPRPYESRLGTKMAENTPPPVVLMDREAQLWRQQFVTLLEDCVAERDSDIHLLPSDNSGLHLLRRRSGHLRWAHGIPPNSTAAFLQAVLTGTGIDLGQAKTMPKDSRQSVYLPVAARRIDLRININPGPPPHTAPAIVLRILDPKTISGGLPQLLYTDYDKRVWNDILNLKSGIVLVTGPTGSGKSQTLYSALQSLHRQHPERSYKSVEDPIELRVGDWLQQNQVNHATGATFAVMLRSFLRADPETIFIGEIRDRETAEVAYNAALSGHLVAASFHVDALAQLPERFAINGVDPSNLASVLKAATAQRLMGRSCPHCRTLVPLPEELKMTEAAQTLERDGFNLGDKIFAENSGCSRCRDLGVKGRFSVQEYLLLDSNETRNAIERKDRVAINAAQRNSGHPTLAERALRFSIPDENEVCSNLAEFRDFIE